MMPSTRRLLILSTALSSCLCASAQKMSIEGKGLPIPLVLDSLCQKTGLTRWFVPDLFNDAPRVDLDLHHVDVREALDSCLAGLRLEYVIERRSIVIRRKPGVGIYLPLTGRVQSATGESLAGVTISAPGVPCILWVWLHLLSSRQ